MATTSDEKRHLDEDNDKAKPAEKRARKATGSRFLRDAACDATKDPKIAELHPQMC